jgi:hypothetical protein
LPLFWPALNNSKIASGKLTIPLHYGMIYRQLPVIEKSQPIAPKDEIKPGAQHQTLRPQKHIYKNIMVSDSGLKERYIQVCTTFIFRKSMIRILTDGILPKKQAIFRRVDRSSLVSIISPKYP